MNPNTNDLKELFLISGDDYDNIINTECFSTTFMKVQFFIVKNYKIINSNEGFKCSCGEMFCWHILKVMYTDKFLDKDTCLDDFKN